LSSDEICCAKRQEAERLLYDYIKLMKYHGQRMVDLFDSITIIT